MELQICHMGKGYEIEKRIRERGEKERREKMDDGDWDELQGEWEDGMAEVSHLILVVHGIGQKGYENLIAKNTEQSADDVTWIELE